MARRGRASYLTAEADRELTHLERHRAELEATILAQRMQRNALVPTSRLPPELLAYIFELVLAFSDDSYDDIFSHVHQRGARAFAAVCREWRTLAIETPLLWRTVAVYQNDRMVDLFLSRAARRAPLTVIAYRPDMTRKSSPAYGKYAEDRLHGVLESGHPVRSFLFSGSRQSAHRALQCLEAHHRVSMEVLDICCWKRSSEFELHRLLSNDDGHDNDGPIFPYLRKLRVTSAWGGFVPLIFGSKSHPPQYQPPAHPLDVHRARSVSTFPRSPRVSHSAR
jgi:hypothetical protein